ncbi:hypothetical protein ABIB49_000473 [Arthrobacter sp. UYCu512]|uniref:hypothetical protein n=1 Tax=Arthrobacter sp. UYCu512 TaxID=3156338 RepID=UPI0033927549
MSFGGGVGATMEFGIGCFAFEWREEKGSRSANDWARDVTDTLSTLPNVSAIDVPGLGDTYMWRAGAPGGDLAIEGYAHPHFHSATVRFDITIPRRHHDLVLPGMVASENYRVVIHYGPESPVAYVVPLDAVSGRGAASTGVMLVRKHLAQHISDTSKVKFSSVGPSPFHAEFYLAAGGRLNEIFECDVVPTRGNDDIVFRYDESSFGDLVEAQTALMQEVGPELSLYYQLVRSRNARSRAAAEVARQAQTLVSLHTERGFKGRWRRLFQSGAQARQLSLAVMDAELGAAWDSEHSEKAIQSCYKSADGYLRSYIDAVAINSLSPLVVNARNVVHQLESGRTKELEITLVTTATLAGAVAGGLISAVVTLMGQG